ncbi:predicted protein [Streptomyces viridosporus ATCC 14672]|uniref:Predicted protein n=1 Tax=Streptomyces viridosporus (strain ATCC 14672 / DSM 40746 / JCM 4963 / KCTC 9882 / NRRL B-12104 / FH 1290) TaxID=566461 RepID=D5ZRU3_STRV1|nr:predicted protein [Streptomyces viridosporus ATCC 14672]
MTAGIDPRRETVPQTDDELLAFDTSDLEDWDEQRARAALGGRHGALYRNHLRIALHLDSWAEAEGRRTDVDAHYRAGYRQALQDMAAFLRQTYYLPRDPD